MTEKPLQTCNGFKCERVLWIEIEKEFGLCTRCLDSMAEREQERREWAYYHPSGDDEP